MSGQDWKSYAEQLQILKDRGLQVADEDSARSDLERIGYYCLSGYWYPFRKLKLQPVGYSYREDDFVEDSNFDDVVSLYIFDKNLRLLALDALERIERAIRVDIAYLLGQRDSFAHYRPAHFHGNFGRRVNNNGRTEHAFWLEHYNKLKYRNRRVPFVAHNVQKFGRLPIWIAIEILDFGALSRLFAGMKHLDKDAIAAKYGLANGLQLQQWLRSLNLVSNVAAHHSRMWNMNMVEVSPVPQFNANWQSLNNHRPFMYFCIIQLLMKTIATKSQWSSRFKKLVLSFPEPSNGALSGTDFGLINGWETWQLWQ